MYFKIKVTTSDTLPAEHGEVSITGQPHFSRGNAPSGWCLHRPRGLVAGQRPVPRGILQSAVLLDSEHYALIFPAAWLVTPYRKITGEPGGRSR